MAEVKLAKTHNPEIQGVLSKLEDAFNRHDVNAALKLFVDDCYWRDLLAFTWNIKTVEGKTQIRALLEARLGDVRPSAWHVDATTEATSANGVTEGFIKFETAVARGYGYIRLRNGLIWTLLTAMQDLKGFEEPLGFTRPFGAKHGEHQGDPTWLEERQDELAKLGITTQPYVLIIGGGQGGIVLGARLRQHGIPALIVEKNERSGDSWRKRYKALSLHDPVWYDHLPYLHFPDNWPVFTPKDKMGDWLEMYTKVMELNYWTHTEARHASYDAGSGTWTVEVLRNGKPLTLHPRQLVFATGVSGKPSVPKFPGQDRFKGIQQHSSEHRGYEGMEGKHVVVIGSNNSAHDICAELATHGVDVTMVQRSSTHVSRSASLMKHALGALYSQQAVAAGLTVDKADILGASIPYALMAGFQKPISDAIRKDDAAFYKALVDAGFLLDFGPDETGLFMKFLRRASGYYIDVGASQLIINGKIKLASGEQVKELREHSVVLADGRELPADVVIYATGYGSMNGWVADIVSQAVADKVGKVYGLGSDTPKDPGPWEGEQRNLWKPTQQDALWFHGGNLAQGRFYSHFVALQLKARMEGIPTPVYGLQKVYHAA